MYYAGPLNTNSFDLVAKAIRKEDDTLLMGMDEFLLEDLNEMPERSLRELVTHIMMKTQFESTELPVTQMQNAWKELDRLRELANEHAA